MFVPAGGVARRARPMTTREGAIVAALSAWSVAGLALDGRAHQDGALDSFFTVWHAILYSGIAAAGAWVAFMARQARRDGIVLRGFALTVAGLVLLAGGGPADLVWHEAFGIEADIAALLSPTHLLLMAGGVLLLSAPLRAAWSDPRAARAPAGAVASLALVTAVVAFFFQYASPLHEVDAFGGGGGELSEQAGLAGLALTNVILVAPLVLLMRRFGTPPRGAVAALLVVPAGMVAVSGDLAVPGALLAVVLAALAAEILAAALRPAPSRPAAFRLFAALVPAILWSLVLGALALGGDLGWPVELWSGSVVLAAAAGLGLSVLALPDQPAGQPLPARPAPGDQAAASSASSARQNVLRAAGVSSTGA